MADNKYINRCFYYADQVVYMSSLSAYDNKIPVHLGTEQRRDTFTS